MSDYIYVFNKGEDSLIIKPHKKSFSLLLRMILVLFAMACGVSMCLFCLYQITTYTYIQSQYIRVVHTHKIRPEPPSASAIPPLQLHYPNPQTFSRGECAHNPVRLFAILSMQRSGSGWFEALLNSCINVSSNGEIFSKLERRQNLSTIINTLDEVYNLDWLSSASKNQCCAAVGLKWMLNQGLMEHHQTIVDYFNRRGVSVVFLFRRNLLRRMVSVLANSYDRSAKLLNGTHKSHVHSPEEAETLSAYKPTINSTSLINDLKETELMTTKALEYFNTTRKIVLYYEDLIKNHLKLNDVQEFLRLPVVELSSSQVKIHKGSLAKHVKNWDDVNKTLNATVYERFLRDDY